ncbi:outer membrane beta-barrel protein [Albibacterium profundi]|uniref:Outer membrane beta-barrel protein n=1 Tax=Albibacterium profundi TaxID=3134906 RepID=A0ABV5CGG8_9SPHI
MKKLLLSIALLGGVVLTSQAQTDKGNFILGGTVSYNTVKSDASGANSAYDFSVAPNVGYFVDDNIAIGTGIGYQTSRLDEASNVGKTEAFVVAPFGRYYTPIANNFKFFGQLSVPMAFGSVKAINEDLETGDKTGSSTSIGVALSPGFVYFPSDKVGLEFAVNGLSYNNYSIEDGDGNTVEGAGYDSFSFGADFFAPSLGIHFYF